MKSILTLAAVALLATAASASAAGISPHVGNWYKDCGKGTKCRIYVQPTDNPNRFTFHFTLNRPDSTPDKPDCTWSVPLKLDKSDGSLWANDPHQNYGFYVFKDKKGNLRSSGTMMPVCGGPRPMEEVFVVDPLDDIGD